MMLDQDVVAVSPSSVYRVLRAEGRLDRWNRKPSGKGKGFSQPDAPHLHWHTDIAYVNVGGTFYYLISVLDGYSRYLVHWELRESMCESDVEIVLQRARERFPEARPRLISDNGSAFIARDFKSFIREAGMTHWDIAVAPARKQNDRLPRRFEAAFGLPAGFTFRPALCQRFFPGDDHVPYLLVGFTLQRTPSSAGP
jgi:transposase InsO family protein